ISRQIEMVKAGKLITLETRLYDADRNVTMSMRSKEEAHDYRYFPDPDLIPLNLEEAWIESIRASLPELPEQKKARYVSDLGLSEYDSGVLTSSKSMAAFFEAAVAALVKQGFQPQAAAKPVSNLLTGEVARRLNDAGIGIEQSKLKPEHLADVAA